MAPSYGFDLVPVMRHAWWATHLAAAVRISMLGSVAVPLVWGHTAASFITTCGLALLVLLDRAIRLSAELTRPDEPTLTSRKRRPKRPRRSLPGNGWTEQQAKDRLKRSGLLASVLGLVVAVLSFNDPGQATLAGALFVSVSAVAVLAATVRQGRINQISKEVDSLRPKALTHRENTVSEQQGHPCVIYRRPEHTGEEDEEDTVFTLFGDESPFIGAGEFVHQWNPPMNIQLLRPGTDSLPLDQREHRKPPFAAHELVDHLREAVADLRSDEENVRLPVEPRDRIYVAEAKASTDRSLLAGGRHESPSNNSGIVNLGGSNSFTNTAFGDHAQVSAPTAPSPSATSGPVGTSGPARRDVGIVTILPGEMRAVVDELGLRRSHKVDDLFFSTGEVTTESGRVSVVATQTLSPGQRSVMGALENLRRHFSPRLWLLVGIGGGLHPEHARIGNVVVSTRVVYYDSRKITEGDQVQPRGEERQAPARVAHAVNAYFTDHGEPAVVRGRAKGHGKRTFEVVPGLIGSGEAVIAAKDSAVRGYLTHYNDKVLAVDMEAGGLSQYWQENSVGEAANPGWVVVRGISDNADQEKNDDSHDLAARNAAHVAGELLPYLC